MRLDSVREVLNANVKKLTIESQPVDNNNNAQISNFKQAIDAIWAIRATGMFQNLCQSLLNQRVISLAAHEPIVVAMGTYRTFSAELNDLRMRVQHVLDALDEFVERLPEDCIRVKLPDTSSVEAAAKIELDLDKLLNQLIVNDYLEGTVSLQAFTQGSLWIDICLGSAAAYRFVAGLVALYFDVKQHQTQQKVNELLFKDLALTAEVRQSLAKAITDNVDAYRQDRMNALLEANAIPDTDHEFRLRIDNSLRMLGGLLERGLEVHPSLTSPIEVRQLFPDPKRLLEAIKSLPSGDEEKEQEK